MFLQRVLLVQCELRSALLFRFISNLISENAAHGLPVEKLYKFVNQMLSKISDLSGLHVNNSQFFRCSLDEMTMVKMLLTLTAPITDKTQRNI